MINDIVANLIVLNNIYLVIHALFLLVGDLNSVIIGNHFPNDLMKVWST